MRNFLAIAWLAVVLTGCNTLNGVGKDLEKAGEAVQKSSK